MTYNIKGHGALLRGKHIERVAELIREVNPDIAGIQEVHRGSWRARFRDQAADLERLTGMQLFFGRAMGEGASEYGNALLTRGSIAGAAVEALPGGREPRSLLRAAIDIDGMRVAAYVTHLTAWGRYGAKTRLMQAAAVARIVAASELPFVLMGDFNSVPSSEELRVFHDGTIVTSCFSRDVITYRATKQCLDYIFAGPGWQIGETEVVRRGPSDHWPMVATMDRG